MRSGVAHRAVPGGLILGRAMCLLAQGCGSSTPQTLEEESSEESTDNESADPEEGAGSSDARVRTVSVERLVDTANVMIGGELYHKDCASCHGESGGGTDDGPRIRGSGSSQLSHNETFSAILEGRDTPAPGTMPAFGPRYTRRQIGDLVAFIATLQ